MNWADFYKKTGNYTVYWFATGKRPGFSQIVGRTLYTHRDDLIENIKAHNVIYNALVPKTT